MNASDPASTAPTAARSATTGRVVRLAVAAGALALTVWLARRVGWSEIGGRLRDAEPALLAVATLLIAGRWAAWGWRWRLILERVAGAHSSRLVFFALMASVMVNLLTPWLRLLGGLSRARYIAQAGHPFARVYATVLFDQAMHHAYMTLWTWIAAVAMAGLMGRTLLALACAALPLAVAVAAAAWSSRRGRDWRSAVRGWLERRAERRAGAADRFLAHGRTAVALFRELLADRRLLVWSGLLTLAFFLLGASGQWLIFAAVGSPVGWLPVIAALAVGTVAGVLSGTPGGLGTTEAAMIAAFASLGVDQVDAVTGTLLFRGLHYGLVIVLGLPPLLWLELRGLRR